MSTLAEEEICGCDFSEITELESTIDQIEHELKKVARKNCNCDLEDIINRIHALKGESPPSTSKPGCPCDSPNCPNSSKADPKPVAESTPKAPDDNALKVPPQNPPDATPPPPEPEITAEKLKENDKSIGLLKDRDENDPETKRLYIDEAIDLKVRLDTLVKILEQAVKYIFVSFEPLNEQLKWFSDRRKMGHNDQWDGLNLVELINDAKVTAETHLLPPLGKWLLKMHQNEPNDTHVCALHKNLRSDKAMSIPQRVIDKEIIRIKELEGEIEQTLYDYVVWMESLPELFSSLRSWMLMYVRENPRNCPLTNRISDFLMFAEDIQEKLLEYISQRNFEESLGLDDFMD